MSLHTAMQRLTIAPLLGMALLGSGCAKLPPGAAPGCDCRHASPATLEFYEAEDTAQPRYSARRYGSATLYLAPSAAITLADARSAHRRTDEYGAPSPGIFLTDEGAEKMRQLTGERIGKKIAVVHNGRIIFAPTIQSEMSNCVIPTADFTEREVCDIVCTVGRAKAD